MIRKHYRDINETAYYGTTSQGLQVIVVPKKDFTKKIAYFATNCGSIHTQFSVDGKGITVPDGVAHYLEHKLFDMPGRDITAEFAALGANPNAFTSFDTTCYYFSCTANFEKCLDLLLEFVSSPHFTEASVKKEYGIIEQEIGMNEDNPDSRVYENLLSAMYSTHPLRVPILGTRDSISKITPEILYSCHKAYYHPKNMVLCVVGDVDPDLVCAAAESKLPQFVAAPAITQHLWEEPENTIIPYISEKMDVSRPIYHIAFKSCALPDGDIGIAQEIAGDMASELLFGESSQLFLEMYEEGLIDNNFGGGYDALDGASFLVCSGEGEQYEEIKDRILKRAREICEEGIPSDAFLRIKRSFYGRRMKSLDSFDSTCFRLCAYYMSKSDYFRFPDIFNSITPEDILRFLRDVVTSARCCISVIHPIEEINHVL